MSKLVRTLGGLLIAAAALAHERLSPARGTTLSDDEMSEIVQETRIDLSVWLRYNPMLEMKQEKFLT